MRIITFLTITLVIAVFYGAYSQDKARIIIDIPTDQKPWNNIEWNNALERFQFAIVTDRTGGHRPGIFMKGVKKLNLLQPEFVMSVGDLIEGYTEDENRLDAEWKEFNGFIDSLQVPFFYVPGNHDITNEVMDKKWKELFGVTYYHFVYQDVLFLALNSEDNYRGAGRGTIDDEQYEYIKKVLEENQDVKWTLVFLHQPLWVQEDTKRWKDVEALLADRNHNVFAGHYHRYWKSNRNNGKYIALATTGGGSRLRGTAYGEFDHVVWVTMTDEGPLLANLLLEGVWDENIVTEDIVELVRNRPYPVRVNPAYTGEKTVASISAPVKITNDSDYKMTVKLDGIVHPSLFYKLDKSEIVVEPNDVVSIDLTISNDQGIDITAIDPILINAEVSYEYEGRPDMVLRKEIKFSPIYQQMTRKATSKVKVDGNFKDWNGDWITVQNMNGKPFDYDGQEDCTIKFATQYDDEKFYVAVDITDEEIYINEKSTPWQQDALIIGLDARLRFISALNAGGGRGRDWLAYIRSFKETDPVYGAESLPEGTESAVSKTKNGIRVEVAFPISYLDEMQRKPWATVRLGVGYYDFDSNGEERTEHFWYPAWNSEENIPGSGMLFKE